MNFSYCPQQIFGTFCRTTCICKWCTYLKDFLNICVIPRHPSHKTSTRELPGCAEDNVDKVIDKTPLQIENKFYRKIEIPVECKSLQWQRLDTGRHKGDAKRGSESSTSKDFQR